MAVTLDASTINNATFASSFSHPGGGSARGALLLVSGPDATVTAASYGGVAMTEIPESPGNTPAGELNGALPPVQIFFLGSGVPVGTQTVSMTGPSANGVLAEIRTFNAAADMEVIDAVEITGGSLANPSATLTLGGRQAAVVEIWQSGHDDVASVTPNAGWSSVYEQDLGLLVLGHYLYDTIGSVDVATVGAQQAANDFLCLGVAVGEVVSGGSDPAISDFGDEDFLDGELGVTIAGANFEAVQGTGAVIISPTDNINDAAAVAQTVTAWADDSITVTIARGALAPGAAMFAFVRNDAGDSNPSGYSVQFSFSTRITETLENKNAAAVASEDNIHLLIWHQAPTQAAPNPDEALGPFSTNGAGLLDVAIANPPVFGQDIWVALFDDDAGGGSWGASAAKITPTYS